MTKKTPVYDRPDISLIAEGVGPDKVALYIGGADGARNVDLLAKTGITTVVNCAVNLDINYVSEPLLAEEGAKCASGPAPVRTYKIGMVDGAGNPEKLILAGYYILEGALEQTWPEKPSYPRRERGNILVHCRGGRSRSVAVVALYLHQNHPETYPTLYDAIRVIRERRELRPDEWHETPKPMLTEAALRASKAIELLDAAKAEIAAVTYDAAQDV